MMEKTNINMYEYTDKAILIELGDFVKATRLEQNKTQQQLADLAGVNRSTIVQIENGSGVTMLSFIQVLRALEQLDLLGSFQVKPIISPLLLAKQEIEKRKRATRTSQPTSNKPKSDW
ncbi:MAG TPA: helix-turn-helix domain-containing protein [Sediminibacterium sp.]|mgnify:FL=1|jgi:transcriptional regulator with XRE-family HTH domain|nr:helix-turn-helix domain-containing protein [Sediminibacterium sp.]